MADWYYIGHYGQLGPLTRENVDDLVQGGVITRETYVWKSGMPQWMPAGAVIELDGAFRLADPFVAPPPPPSMMGAPQYGPPQTQTQAPSQPMSPGTPSLPPMQQQVHPAAWGHNPYAPAYTVKSDRSRTVGGVLQIILPGVGRLYLGYMAYGVLQLVVTIFTCGIVGYIWGIVDGILILSNGLKMDGYGRTLSD